MPSLTMKNFLQPEGKYKIHLATPRGQKVSSPHEHMFSKHQSCFKLNSPLKFFPSTKNYHKIVV